MSAHDPFAAAPRPGTDAFYNAQNAEQQQARQVESDPAAGTVDEVKARVESGDVSADDVLAAEERGKRRSTLLDWLRER